MVWGWSVDVINNGKGRFVGELIKDAKVYCKRSFVNCMSQSLWLLSIHDKLKK